MAQVAASQSLSGSFEVGHRDWPRINSLRGLEFTLRAVCFLCLLRHIIYNHRHGRQILNGPSRRSSYYGIEAGDPSDAEERSRIDQLIADQLDGGDESGSEASLESDDDDEYSSSSESGEDGYELAEDDEKEELAHVEEKMQQERSITADVASPLPPSNGGLLPSENQLRGMEMAAEHAQIEKDCDEVRLPPPFIRSLGPG